MVRSHSKSHSNAVLKYTHVYGLEPHEAGSLHYELVEYIKGLRLRHGQSPVDSNQEYDLISTSTQII